MELGFVCVLPTVSDVLTVMGLLVVADFEEVVLGFKEELLDVKI